MKNRMFSMLFLICLFAFISCEKIPLETTPSLVGAWKVTEIATVGPDVDEAYYEVQPSLFLFTQNHYSMIWTPGQTPRLDSEKIWEPTDEEKIRNFNTLIVNSGTYTLTDSTFTTSPVVAKTPEFVGGSALYSYHTQDDSLWVSILNTISRDGVVDSGIAVYRTSLKLVRIE